MNRQKSDFLGQDVQDKQIGEFAIIGPTDKTTVRQHVNVFQVASVFLDLLARFGLMIENMQDAVHIQRDEVAIGKCKHIVNVAIVFEWRRCCRRQFECAVFGFTVRKWSLRGFQFDLHESLVQQFDLRVVQDVGHLVKNEVVV